MSEDEINGVKIQRLPTVGSPYSIKTIKQGRRLSISDTLKREEIINQPKYKYSRTRRKKK